MCFIEAEWFSHAHTFTRRQLLGTGFAAGLTAAAGLAASSGEASSLLPGLNVGAQAPPSSGGPGTSGVKFKWLGTNGWEIAFGNKTILVDPWFARSDIGFFAGKFDPKAPLQVNETMINQHITRADQILIGHGHWDHISDVPFIQKKTGAQVIGTETHANIFRAFGVEEGKIVQVKGGEVMQFDGYTIEVFPGLHSLGPTKKFAVPGHRVAVPAMPTTVGDLPEGDSLIYLITIGGKYSIFLMSTANYIERAIAGIKPDVALVASIFASQIHDFTPRLLKALNNPKVILPTHWDNFERPFSEGPRDLRDVFGDAGNLDLWVRDVKRVSPQSNVVVMKFFESYAP